MKNYLYDKFFTELELLMGVLSLPSVAKTSTSQRLKLPSTPTSCKKTYCPTSALAQTKVFVIPSSVICQHVLINLLLFLEKCKI